MYWKPVSIDLSGETNRKPIPDTRPVAPGCFLGELHLRDWCGEYGHTQVTGRRTCDLLLFPAQKCTVIRIGMSNQGTTALGQRNWLVPSHRRFDAPLALPTLKEA